MEPLSYKKPAETEALSSFEKRGEGQRLHQRAKINLTGGEIYDQESESIYEK